MKKKLFSTLMGVLLISSIYAQFSGIFPDLAMFNYSNECGPGAVVPWYGKLYAITYSPHSPNGSSDKLYIIDEHNSMEIYDGSVGGTPANRMIHKESNQLIIGPYFIDSTGGIRVIPPAQMYGRLTGVARHLTNPDSLVYFYTMEEGWYEVNVHTLEVETLNVDGNAIGNTNGTLFPGYHGKGAYTGQNRLIVSNNGEVGGANVSYTGPSGSLNEYKDGSWSLVERMQFVEVTGPGGIYGNSSMSDPVWATGWDEKSVVLKLLDNDKWYTYRIPKASYTYDGKHGWHTEWPRIRRVNDTLLLMTMHGTMFDFPETFSFNNSAGIKPLTTYLKMVVDMAPMADSIVLACNDASKFSNKLVGQAQSNLLFTSVDEFKNWGPRDGFGGVWMNDDVSAGNASVPYLFANYDRKVLHISHTTSESLTLTVEIDKSGNNTWEKVTDIEVPAKAYKWYEFPEGLTGEWVRLSTNKDGEGVTAFFHYTDSAKGAEVNSRGEGIFKSLPFVDSEDDVVGGIVRLRGNDERALQYIARYENGGDDHYRMNADMKINTYNNNSAYQYFLNNGDVTSLDFSIDDASAYLTKDGKKYRLPKGHKAYAGPFEVGFPRGHREVVTERSLWNLAGSFYEIPRNISGGIPYLKPICTHNRKITDFASYRGMLVLVGTNASSGEDGHYIKTEDGKAGLWFGNVDDLWRMGQPKGVGSTWKNKSVNANVPSDPYVMLGYDEKRLLMSHKSTETVEFKVEVDVSGKGNWNTYGTFNVVPGDTLIHTFPDGYSAHWVRTTVNKNCEVTATFVYDTEIPDKDDSTTSIPKPEGKGLEQIRMYPNPAKDYLTIISVRNNKINIVISDLSGQVIYQDAFLHHVKIDIRKRTGRGVFTVRLNSGNEWLLKRLVVL